MNEITIKNLIVFLQVAVSRVLTGRDFKQTEILKAARELNLLVEKEECVYQYAEDLRNACDLDELQTKLDKALLGLRK